MTTSFTIRAVAALLLACSTGYAAAAPAPGGEPVLIGLIACTTRTYGTTGV